MGKVARSLIEVARGILGSHIIPMLVRPKDFMVPRRHHPPFWQEVRAAQIGSPTELLLEPWCALFKCYSTHGTAQHGARTVNGLQIPRRRRDAELLLRADNQARFWDTSLAVLMVVFDSTVPLLLRLLACGRHQSGSFHSCLLSS